jgi:phosphohistidine swiveling domain-containing protein
MKSDLPSIDENKWPDPLHQHSAPLTFWTTVNVGEAMPGVPTPLSWSMFAIGNEVSVPRTYYRLGILAKREVVRAQRIDDRFAAVFYGRAAMNVTRLRAAADLTPGTSGDAMEAQLLGSVREGITSHNSARRLPFVAVKFPFEMSRLPSQLRKLHAEQHRWWKARTSEIPKDSQALLGDAVQHFDDAMCTHVIGVAVTQALFDQLHRLAEAAGDPALVAELASGYGNFEEADMVSALWQVSRDRLTVADFVARYGFHGPDEGEISATSWREDPELVLAITRKYTERGVDDGVAAKAARRQRRLDAERELLTRLPAAQRIKAKVLLRLAQRYLPLREVGKAAFLMALDVARFAARCHGQELVGAGDLAGADDVFAFTVDEVVRGLAGDTDVAAVAAWRKAKRVEYQALSLPDRWEGNPEARAAATATLAQDGETITGVSITNGVVEGSARVAATLDVAEDLEEDEILVCEVTDPSWCALFPLVAGMVVDIGGPLSHAAIVAREMGIPCIVNTKDAVARLQTGMRVRLDATNGTVTVLDARPAPAPASS